MQLVAAGFTPQFCEIIPRIMAACRHGMDKALAAGDPWEQAVDDELAAQGIDTDRGIATDLRISGYDKVIAVVCGNVAVCRMTHVSWTLCAVIDGEPGPMPHIDHEGPLP